MERQMTLAEINDELGTARTNKIFILQNVYNLSDMAAMNEVIDSRAFSNFCGINAPSEVPNGDMIGRFRNIMTRNGLQGKIFAAIVKILMERKLILKKGTIVDSTFIESPFSHKEPVKVTPANEHDVTVMSELLHGEEEHVYGDSGYIGVNKRPEAIKKNKNGKKIKYLINRRPSSIKK